MKLTIDRFEGTKAVLISNSQQLIINRAQLPNGVKEGDVLRVTFILDLKATQTNKNQVSGLIKKVFKE